MADDLNMDAAFGEEQPDQMEELKTCSADELKQRVRLLENDIRVLSI